jgi:hypothetical protein
MANKVGWDRLLNLNSVAFAKTKELNRTSSPQFIRRKARVAIFKNSCQIKIEKNHNLKEEEQSTDTHDEMYQKTELSSKGFKQLSINYKFSWNK